jgi:hypothetical protein
MKRAALAAWVTVGLLAPVSVVTAQPADSADVAFQEAKSLRAQGKLSEACAKFAESQQLAAGVGITLYLADCHQRLGRLASALREFRRAEQLAHELHDVRETVAKERAAALDTKAPRLILEAPPMRPDTPPEVYSVQLDGEVVEPAKLGALLLVDAGDHVVTVDVPGRPRRTLPVHVDADAQPVTVRLVEPEPIAAPTPTPVVPSGAAPQEATPPAPAPSSLPSSSLDPSAATRKWVTVGLLGAGVVAFGAGVTFLAIKNHSLSTGAPDGSPQQDDAAATASAVAFGMAATAFVSAVVLYLAAPQPSSAAMVVTPVPVAGGGGTVLRATF